MTIDEFNDNLDRWGSELEAWPVPARSQGAALLKESTQARRQYAHAQRIDTLLATEHRAPPTMRHQILQQLPRAQAPVDDIWQRLADWFAGALWKPSLAAACLLALGFTAGITGDVEDLTDSDLEEASMLAFSDNYQEIDDAY